MLVQIAQTFVLSDFHDNGDHTGTATFDPTPPSGSVLAAVKASVTGRFVSGGPTLTFAVGPVGPFNGAAINDDAKDATATPLVSSALTIVGTASVNWSTLTEIGGSVTITVFYYGDPVGTAAGIAYATAATYRAVYGLNDTAHDVDILADLVSMSRVIDAEAGRAFLRDNVVSVRRYRPAIPRAETLFVEDIASVTGLIVKEDRNGDGVAETTLTLDTDYELWPRNAAVGLGEAVPYTALFRLRRATWAALVEVTALHGWPAIPKAIERYVCQLTGIWRLDSPRATTRIAEDMAATIGTSRQGREILDRINNAYGKPPWIFS